MNMRNRICALGVIGLLASVQAAASEPQSDDAAKRALPGAVVSGEATAVATVEAVDMNTREISLREADGSVTTLIAGDDVRNLEQLEKGDRVAVEHKIGIIMQLSPAPGGVVERRDRLEMERAEPGQKPGGVVRKIVEATAEVVAVDRDARTLTLRGPQRTLTLPVAEDIDLDAIKVGDEVEAIYQESVAIRVTPASAQ